MSMFCFCLLVALTGFSLLANAAYLIAGIASPVTVTARKRASRGGTRFAGKLASQFGSCKPLAAR
jgi:hypothetical protein